MQRVLTLFFFLLLSVSCRPIHQENTTPMTSSEPATAQNIKKLELEMRKLELETKELQRKMETALTFGLFNEPIVTSLVTTILTLIVGGLLIGALSDIRARKNKRLDEYHLMINNVASDLAGVFTPLYQYIRHPSHRLDAAKHEIADEQWLNKIILRVQRERIPRLFQRRLSLYVTAEALLPSQGEEIARDYFEICRDLQAISRQLRNHVVSGTYDGDKIPQRVKTNARNNIDSDLKPPFKEFDQLVEGIWIRANELLTITIKNPSESIFRRIYPLEKTIPTSIDTRQLHKRPR
jgi:hypothetical protein